IAMQANSVADVHHQERLLQTSEAQTAKLRYVADILLGAELLSWDRRELIEKELEEEEKWDDAEGERPAQAWLQAKKATERFRRAARTRAALDVERYFHESSVDELQERAAFWLSGRQTFHWPLEFPEVFIGRNGFDTVIGNPPYRHGSR